ncbi:DNA polymerase III subunit chi [Plastoroseomonas arctica]|uniref:DNA polymerase III subunit chi n=1 Tax=Plastoroseomonas arctica TaxID=1509237 RepID=A0AAF1KKR4_9PROT|nr:DNA polymerase III subunit chi [Plastoroseomonas arctica]MBR0656880.1 DNA polymerase III subunit chi [Plastoroseomonas arctica]
MAEIGFYHLTRTSIDAAAPKLLGRILAGGGRAHVLCGTAERMEALDASLWLSTDPDWLPHGRSDTEHARHQPILLATGDVAPVNGARFLLLLDGASTMRASEYDRVLDLFDGNDEGATAAARARWASAKAAGHGLSYMKQGAKGWEKAG